MDEKLMNRILEDREVKFDELPEDFDISLLPEDVEIIFEEDFEELDDDFWED